eukprot:TRINITY_DN20494_c0_g1_i1.p2 TRINITY_DN20494_c0_g1~~TRINITY_DN20494_c0_g1_i1.p2  ORF type:complete len:240 (-),score=62.66 TRINITY_DN20494_c0_g1_i1:832-1551(-)
MRSLVLLSLFALGAIAITSVQTDCTYEVNGWKYDFSRISSTDITYDDENNSESYYIRLCDKVEGISCNGGSVCVQFKNMKTSKGKLTTAATTGGEDGKGLKVSYSQGDECSDGKKWSSQVTLVCDQSVLGNGEVTNAVNDFGTCLTTVTMKSKYACANKSSKSASAKKGLSTGSVILIIFFSCVAVYIVAGCVFNYKKNDKRGIEMVPNIDFWKDIPSLVVDGFLFAKNGFKKDNFSKL